MLTRLLENLIRQATNSLSFPVGPYTPNTIRPSLSLVSSIIQYSSGVAMLCLLDWLKLKGREPFKLGGLFRGEVVDPLVRVAARTRFRETNFFFFFPFQAIGKVSQE